MSAENNADTNLNNELKEKIPITELCSNQVKENLIQDLAKVKEPEFNQPLKNEVNNSNLDEID